MEDFEQDMQGIMKGVSGVRVPAEVSAGAVVRALWQVRARGRVRRWGRAIFWGAAAAVIGVMLTVVIPSRSISRAPAYGAELMQAMSETRAETGWAHVEVTVALAESGKVVERSSHDFNANEAVAAHVTRSAEGQVETVVFESEAEGKQYVYRAGADRVEVSAMPVETTQPANGMFGLDPTRGPTTITGIKQAVIKKNGEGKLMWAEVTMDWHGKAWAWKKWDYTGNPETGKLWKIDAWYRDGAGRELVEHRVYTYGGSGVKDVYEAGAPRGLREVEVSGGTRP